jgi:hypothetical protein
MLRPSRFSPTLTFFCSLLLLVPLSAADLRVAVIGTDSSHAEQFTLRLNDSANPNHVPGARVVKAFPAGSPDLPMSQDRITDFTTTLRDKLGVQIVDSIQQAVVDVDAIMLLSLDGRPHLNELKAVAGLKKPIFLDKPVAASLKDVVEIYQVADEAGTPLFSASSLRWYPGVVEVATAQIGETNGAMSYGPAPALEHHPDLFFYGIHPTEALFTVLGTGCLSVVCSGAPTMSIATGTWTGGRLGTLVALHQGAKDYKVVRFGAEKIVEQRTGGDYTPMIREIVTFFKTGTPPVAASQTIEIYAFMEAANESKRRGGRPITLREVLEKAHCPEQWLPPAPATKS